MELRTALERMWTDWRDDLSADWSAALRKVEPSLEAVGSSLELGENEVIFPGRKGRAPPGARIDSHAFRAMDSIAPERVRVVVIGQDPYTHVSQATGRSFEQGDLHDWLGAPRVSPSLQHIMQAVVVSRTGDRTFADSQSAWQARVVADIQAGKLNLAPPRELWDHWQTQGVLFVNAILTFSRFDPQFQFGGHGPFWAPIVQQLFAHLATRPSTPLVFVAWGGKAEAALAKAGAVAAAKAVGAWGRTVTVIKGPHPNAIGPGVPPFLRQRDPMDEINRALRQVGGDAIRW